MTTFLNSRGGRLWELQLYLWCLNIRINIACTWMCQQKLLDKGEGRLAIILVWFLMGHTKLQNDGAIESRDLLWASQILFQIRHSWNIAHQKLKDACSMSWSAVWHLEESRPLECDQPIQRSERDALLEVVLQVVQWTNWDPNKVSVTKKRTSYGLGG